jgi:hypothetical protein
MPNKLNLGQAIKINAFATDTLGLKVPKILEMLNVDIIDKETLDEIIEKYGNEFSEWLFSYVKTGLPSYDGGFPTIISNNAEIRNFVYDLIINFYISRMLLIELIMNNGESS